MPARAPVAKVMRPQLPQRRKRVPRPRIIQAILPLPPQGTPSEVQSEIAT